MMKDKKKLLYLVSAIALVLVAAVVIVCLVTCGNNNGNNGQNDGQNNSENNNQNNNNNNNETNNGDGNNNGTNDPQTYDYTVKVIDGNGNAVEGAVINLSVLAVGNFEIVTNASGVATHNMAESKLPVYAEIKTLPEGYGLGDESEVTIAPGSKSATIDVVKQVKYSAVLKDAAGNAVSGVNVQVCVGELCLTGKNTDENGEVYFYVNPTEETVKLQINGLDNKKPHGFNYDSDTGSYYQYFEESQTSKEVTILDV